MEYSDDESDASSNEELSPAPAAHAMVYPPIQHNAKELRLHNSDDSSSEAESMEDDDDSIPAEGVNFSMESMEDDDGSVPAHEANFAIQPPRGKVLRIPTRDDDGDDGDGDGDDSDDDDSDEEDAPQVAVVADEEDLSIADSMAEEETSIREDEESDEEVVAVSAIKSKNGSGGDEEEDVAVAAVVVDGNDSDASEVAAVAEVVPKKVRKKPGPKPKDKGTPRSGDKRKSGGGTPRRKRSASDSDVSVNASTISREKLEAAQQARDILLASMQQTPFQISDSHVVRNFGRIKIEDESSEPLFSNATSLFPVGFSCDRHEFSPVHGRVIKLRCEILDSRVLQVPSDESGEEDKKSAAKTDGPIFRITWGQGIDELDDGKPFPFDLYSASAPLSNGVDTVAVPVGLDTVSIKPEKEMRVKVRFDDDIWYRGTIIGVCKKAPTPEAKEKKKRGTRSASKTTNTNQFIVSIEYDDGMKEEVVYPDPDVILVAPGKSMCECVERFDDCQRTSSLIISNSFYTRL